MNYLTLLFATAISEPEKLWNYKLLHFLSRIRDRGSHSWSVNRFDWNAKGQYASCDVFGIGRSRSYVRYGFWTTDKKNHRADTTWPPSTYVVSYVVGNSFNKFVGSNLEDGAALFWVKIWRLFFVFMCMKVLPWLLPNDKLVQGRFLVNIKQRWHWRTSLCIQVLILSCVSSLSATVKGKALLKKFFYSSCRINRVSIPPNIRFLN